MFETMAKSLASGKVHHRCNLELLLGFAGLDSKIASATVPSHQYALATGGRLIRVLRLFDLCDEKIKAPANVLVIASAGFGPGTIVLLGQLLPIICGDLALLGAEIALVAHNDNGDPLDALQRSGNSQSVCWFAIKS